jgi:hypothetical protein
MSHFHLRNQRFDCGFVCIAYFVPLPRIEIFVLSLAGYDFHPGRLVIPEHRRGSASRLFAHLVYGLEGVTLKHCKPVDFDNRDIFFYCSLHDSISPGK